MLTVKERLELLEQLVSECEKYLGLLAPPALTTDDERLEDRIERLERRVERVQDVCLLAEGASRH